MRYTDGIDVTDAMLQELESLNRFSDRHAIKDYSRKEGRQPLTKTEKAALELIPDDGLDLGYISGTLAYDDTLDGLPVTIRKAINSLLYRGRLRIIEVADQGGEKPVGSTRRRRFMVHGLWRGQSDGQR